MTPPNGAVKNTAASLASRAQDVRLQWIVGTVSVESFDLVARVIA